MRKILEELKKQYPKEKNLEQRFLPGATEEELELFSEDIDLILPETLRNMYQEVNGEKQYLGIFIEFSMMSLEKIKSEMKYLKNLPAVVPCTQEEYACEDGFKKGWIPFADDADGSFFIVDLNPDKKGTVGQVIAFDCREWKTYILAESLDQFLEKIVEKIKTKEITLTEQEIISWKFGYEFSNF